MSHPIPLVKPAGRRLSRAHAAGLSHTGFGVGGAIGEILAEWLVEGEPLYDVTELNVRRFGASAAARARESYRHYYVLRYPDS